jgi:hypothetical protein
MMEIQTKKRPIRKILERREFASFSVMLSSLGRHIGKYLRLVLYFGYLLHVADAVEGRAQGRMIHRSKLRRDSVGADFQSVRKLTNPDDHLIQGLHQRWIVHAILNFHPINQQRHNTFINNRPSKLKRV